MENSKPQGVYNNRRLMYVCTAISGSVVHLQTKDGSVWEGIFSTFSSGFTICLDLAIQIDPKLESKDYLIAALQGGSQAKKQAFFDLKDIVRITVVDVDLNYATKDAQNKLATDADISGFNSSKISTHKELESWQDDDGDVINDESLMSLDDVAADGKTSNQNKNHGWNPQEMFRFNERVHKVNSTYDDDLKDYTIALPKHNSKEWRKKQERAAAIAEEIENNPKSMGRLAKEDGSDCEEDKFSAVIRPSQSSPQNNPNDHLPQQSTQIHHHQQQQQQQQQHSQHQPQQQQQQPPHRHQQHQQQHHLQHPHQSPQQLHHQQQQPRHRPMLNRINPGNQNGNHKNFRPRFDRNSRLDSLKNFSRQLNITPTPGQQQEQPGNTSKDSSNKDNTKDDSHENHSDVAKRPNVNSSQAEDQTSSAGKDNNVSANENTKSRTQDNQSESSQKSEVSSDAHSESVASQSKDSGQDESQSELAKKSKLNPNAKEFVYKPKSPASIHSAQMNGSSQMAMAHGGVPIDPALSSPMPQVTNGPYYQQVPIFPHGMSPQQQHHHAAYPHGLSPQQQQQQHAAYQHGLSPQQQQHHAAAYQHGLLPQQQQHHAAQFMPNHLHFQNQIHYIPAPVGPHYAPQQMWPQAIPTHWQAPLQWRFGWPAERERK